MTEQRKSNDEPDDRDERDPDPRREQQDEDEPRRGDPPVDERERRKLANTRGKDNKAGLPRDEAQQRVDEPSHRHGPIVAGPEGRKAGQPGQDESEPD